MRRWIVFGLLIALVWFLVAQRAHVEEVARVIVRGQLLWVLAAAVLQVGFYIFFTGIFHSAFDVVGVRSRWLPLVPVTLAVVFVGTVAPSGGFAGLAVFVDDARKRGQSAARTAAGTLLGQTADFVGFLPILVVGLLMLSREHHLAAYQIVAAILMFAVLGGLTTALTLGLWRPAWVHTLVRVPQRVVNGLYRVLRKPPVFTDEWAAHTAEEFRLAAVALTRRPAAVVRTALYAFLGHAFGIISLYCVCLAFHQPVAFAALVAGYAMCILFWIVSITPQGVGFVEAAMALAFTSFGMTLEAATVIALAYRGLAFWIPMALGAVTMRQIAQPGAAETAPAAIAPATIEARDP